MTALGAVRTLLAAAHPGPAVVVTGVTAGLGAAVGARPARIALLTAGMLAGQLSVGWSNDWIDADRDIATGRTDKPVATGAVPRSRVRTAALVALAPALLLPALASRRAAAAHAVFVASAWSYNVGLKRTPASVVPYLVSFGSLPGLASRLLDPPRRAPWWAAVAGAALGAAAHLANALPDLEDDLATGVSGLPHRLGARTTSLTGPAILVGGIAAILLGPGRRPSPVALGAAGAGLGAAAGALTSALRADPGRAPFRFVMTAALATAGLLLASGRALGGGRLASSS